MKQAQSAARTLSAARTDQRIRERKDGETVLKMMGYSTELMDKQLQRKKDEIFTPGENQLVRTRRMR